MDNLFLLITVINAQFLEIQDLRRNQGLLTLELGAGNLITSYNNLIHIVNLTSYKENIDIIENNINTLTATPELSDQFDLNISLIVRIV